MIVTIIIVIRITLRFGSFVLVLLPGPGLLGGAPEESAGWVPTPLDVDIPSVDQVDHLPRYVVLDLVLIVGGSVAVPQLASCDEVAKADVARVL